MSCQSLKAFIVQKRVTKLFFPRQGGVRGNVWNLRGRMEVRYLEELPACQGSETWTRG